MKWESMFDGKHNAKKYHHDVKQKKKKSEEKLCDVIGGHYLNLKN